MRRHGNLWGRITDAENIRLAYGRAAEHKGGMRNVLKFKQNLEENLEGVRCLLVDKTYKTSRYSEKKVYEPKERVLYILPFNPDRVVHHALMNITAPIWKGLFIRDTYACIKGRGIHAASQRAMEFVRRNKYVLKCDIAKFYPSIDQEILLSVIKRKIKCEDTLWLIGEIIHSFPGGKNAPIGNYTSQWFGNLIMNEVDQYAKNCLKCGDYVRYNDDFCIFSDDKKYLHECRSKIEAFLAGRLKLSYSKADVFPVSQGLDFVGYRHFDNYKLCRKSTAKRVRKRLEGLPRLYAEGKITAGQFRSSVGSTWGWLKHANTRNLMAAIKFKELQNEVKKLV